MQNFVLKDRSLYKEFVPIVLKIENNFQIRDLMKTGDHLMEGYLSELFKFTLDSYKIPSESIKYHASKLNHLWQRVYFESIALSVNCKGKLDEII